MRIFLIGYMLSGKSTVGKKISKSLGLEFIDTDKYITHKYNTTIDEIFSTKGEEYFREIETQTLLELIQKDNVLISTGGGMPCFNNNISLINQNGISVYLKCSPLTILQRLQTSKTSRPILNTKSTDELFDYVHKNIAEREEYYNQANLIIKGESPNLKELISQIQNL